MSRKVCQRGPIRECLRGEIGEEQLTWLDCHAAVARHIREWRIGGVELRDPQDIIRRRGGSRCDVAVVRPDRHACAVPLQVDLASGVAEWDGLVLGDGWCAVLVCNSGVQAGGAVNFAGDKRVRASGWLVDGLLDLGCARLVQDGQGWEILPDETCLIGISNETREGFWEALLIRTWFSGHALMYGASSVQAHDCGTPVSNHTGMGKRPSNCKCWVLVEPHLRNRRVTCLTEDHLLSCLCGDGLQEKLSHVARIKMVQEAVDTRLAKSDSG
jgi:hypothetical protein